jgi:hypothetical protein
MPIEKQNPALNEAAKVPELEAVRLSICLYIIMSHVSGRVSPRHHTRSGSELPAMTGVAEVPCTEPLATSSGYGDLVERPVAVSIKCRRETVVCWAAKDGIVSFREAALAPRQFRRVDSTKMLQRILHRAPRSRGREHGGLSASLFWGRAITL